MAQPGRTVRLNDLPTDIDDDRLKDKLSIHFLRSRNGGGEIDSVIIDKATPGSALIVFEDSAVAQRVIQRSWHSLDVDGRKYKISATEYRENSDPDKIILNLSATVDYRWLPGGTGTLTSFSKSHSEVKMRYSETYCMLSGPYSKVQAALAQLLGHTEGAKAAEDKDSNQATPRDSSSSQNLPKQKPDGQSRKTTKQKEKNLNGRPSKDFSSSSSKNVSAANYGFGDNPEDAVLQSEEDLSLILDADMFQYLQKCCQKEYRDILSRYNVEVIDETNEDLVTLFLRIAETELTEDGREQERLKLARKAISQLYQKNEEIRRDKLPKVILSDRKGLQRAMDDLCVKFPKLLLNEDDQNIYIIGGSSDVSEAKHALLFMDHREVRDNRDDAASAGRYSSYHLDSSLSHGNKEEIPLRTQSAAQSLDDREYSRRMEEDESKAEKNQRRKLAARFIDSGLNLLGNRPVDFTLRTNSVSSRQTRVGPMLGHDVLSERAGISTETISGPQNTGEDLLFRDVSTVPSSASLPTKTSVNTDMLDARPKDLTSASSFNVTSYLGGTSLPPPGFESNLKRANSFSGTPQQKTQLLGQKTHEDSSKSSVRARVRSSSFSNQTGRNKEFIKQEVYQREISVAQMMWEHIKEAYRTRIDDLTSDIQWSENFCKTSREVTLILKGADSSIVELCQHGLQKLIDSVQADFSIQELRLSDLGNPDINNETLQACCSEVKSRFHKVTLKLFTNSLYFFGPKQLCSQVCAAMQEIFCGESAPQTSKASTSSLQTSEHQSSSLPPSSTSKTLPRSQTSKGNGTSGNQEWNTTYRSDFCEIQVVNRSDDQSSASQGPVFKEKVKIADKVEDGAKVKPFVNQLGNNQTSSIPVNGDEKERPISGTQTETTGKIQSTPEESRGDEANQMSICVCGKKGLSFRRTKCGASLCPKCMETVHTNCRVCHEMEWATPSGIQGEMKTSRLSISLPGHNKDCVIKITYRIPDGIQGKDHPSPGKPFQGGTFEAYLPDCEATMKLLPRLEEAFRQGLTFTVTGTEARVTWDAIPHKTSLQGGKAQKGYPDSSYLTRLSEVLTSHGV